MKVRCFVARSELLLIVNSFPWGNLHNKWSTRNRPQMMQHYERGLGGCVCYCSNLMLHPQDQQNKNCVKWIYI
jgi:hypothetical protein